MAKKSTRTSRRTAKKTAAPKAAPALTTAEIAAAERVETKAYDFPAAVMLMDQASQYAFNKIVSIAKLTRAGVSKINGQFGPVGPDDIQNALSAIIIIANEAKNDINVLAEDVDCNYSDVAASA